VKTCERKSATMNIYMGIDIFVLLVEYIYTIYAHT